MNEKIQAAKDEAASEAGYKNYDEFLYYNSDYPETITKFINRAMEIYAEMVAVEFAERLRRNYTNHLTGGGGWRYYGDKKEKVITTQELFNRFNTKP